jgi:uncharacterized protein involved in outer membrane biogenesis
MKKVLKWTSVIFGSFLLILLLAAFVIPNVFKGDIRKAIDAELAKSINADVVFDTDNFSLTLFRHFPNITVEIRDLGILNREPFAGQVLFATQKLDVEVNLKDILFGDEIRLKGISLIKPIINIKVLQDGRANYDIAVPSPDSVVQEAPGSFSFGIDHWEIVDGDMVYEDDAVPLDIHMKGLNHTGKGDFSNISFDLATHTVVDTLSATFDGVEYLTRNRAEAEAIIAISEDYTRYTFKQNVVKINDFLTSFNGSFKMNDDSYGMDITFSSPQNSFKSLLSIIPGMYTERFSSIETKGSLSFDGLVKGVYSAREMPAFRVDLKVNEGMFKYPDLPEPVTGINVDLEIDNKDGIVDNTSVNLKRLQMNFGSNPLEAKATIENLHDYRMDASVIAQLDLAALTRMFPMEGLDLKGNYSIDLKAKGIYDSVRNIMPAVDASMVLANGYIKSSSFPVPLQDVKFQATVKNATGKMTETKINVKDFSMLMDGERFAANLRLEDLVDYNWDLTARGALDLEKITKIFPQEGISMAGKITADISTKGKYSDLEAKKYDRLPTSGTASVTGFSYVSKELPYDVRLSQAAMSFDPQKINVQKLDGTIGRSDFSLSGAVLNYLGYALGKGESIKGVVNFKSRLLDLNEFMTDTEESTTNPDSYGVVPVPRDIDFLVHSSIDKVSFMDFNVANASGDVLVKDGIANLNGLKFSMLGGTFTLDGTYDTRDLDHPKFDMAMKIERLSIQQASQSLTLVQTYAPIAGLVKGDFSTDFKLSGELLPNMSPNLRTVNADGLIKIAQAALAQSKIISGIASLTNLENADQVTLKDVLMSAKITDGRLSVKPFEVKFGDYRTSVTGSTGLDGSIDYTLKMNVPAGKVGSQVQSFLNKNTGSNNPTDEIPLTIALGNTYKEPKLKLVADEQKEQAKEAVTNAAKTEGQKVLKEAVKGTEAEELVRDILGGDKKESAATSSDSTNVVPASQGKEEVKKQVQEEAKKKIQNLLKRKD